MTDPRQPDDVRLSTADLATAGERQRVPADRDVTDEQRLHHADMIADATSPARATTSSDSAPTPLFVNQESEDFRHRWNDIQTGFVDEPRQAVERADELVASAIKRLAEIFATERSSLEEQWARGGDASTEDLRVALRRYRAFFDRLLSV
jgi:hypothetical protein